MAKGYNLGDLRAAIQDINRDVTSERGSGEAINSDVLARLKKTRPALVELFTPQLVDIALINLLNQVCRRNAAGNRAQSSLFEGYSRIPNMVTIAKEKKKSTEKLTLQEAEDWIRNHSKRTIKNEYEDFQRLVDECRRLAKSDTETIEDILKRKRTETTVQDALKLDS
jgi:hypothetical protein